MKVVHFISILVFLSCSLSCNKLNKTEQIKAINTKLDAIPTSNKKKNNMKNIEVELSKKLFSEGSMENSQLRIINNSNDTIFFGTHFKLEKKVEHKWENTHAFDEIVFDDLLNSCIPNSSRTEKILFKISDYKYESGDYRIVKKLKYKNTELKRFAEFRIE